MVKGIRVKVVDYRKINQYVKFFRKRSMLVLKSASNEGYVISAYPNRREKTLDLLTIIAQANALGMLADSINSQIGG
jgi:hypothetical protein